MQEEQPEETNYAQYLFKLRYIQGLKKWICNGI